VPGWTCPDCGRLFRRSRQSHECAPAMSLEEYLATGPPHEGPIVEAVLAYARTLGPLHIEPVSVGVFLKRTGRFAELRPMQKWEALSFSLPRKVGHRTITRKVVAYHGRYWHVANLKGPADFDQELKAYLAEAYDQSPD